MSKKEERKQKRKKIREAAKDVSKKMKTEKGKKEMKKAAERERKERLEKGSGRIKHFKHIHRKESPMAQHNLKKIREDLKKKGEEAAVMVEFFPGTKEDVEKEKEILRTASKHPEKLEEKMEELGVAEYPEGSYLKKRLETIKGTGAEVFVEPSSIEAMRKEGKFRNRKKKAKEALEKGEFEKFLENAEEAEEAMVKQMKARDEKVSDKIKEERIERPERDILTDRGKTHRSLEKKLKEKVGGENVMVQRDTSVSNRFTEVAAKESTGKKIDEDEKKEKVARGLLSEKLSGRKDVSPKEAKIMADQLKLKDIEKVVKNKEGNLLDQVKKQMKR